MTAPDPSPGRVEPQPEAQVSAASRRERRRFDLVEWIYQHLGSEWGGSTDVPGHDASLYLIANGVGNHERAARRFEEAEQARADGKLVHVASPTNDGFELSIGYLDEWLVSLDRAAARRLAWFILWRWWARGEWFGLRRKLWYWALHRKCERHRRSLPLEGV